MVRGLAGGQIAAGDDDRAAFCAWVRPGRSGKHTRSHRLQAVQALVRQRCARAPRSGEELRRGGCRRRLSTVRAQLAVHRVTRLGLSVADAARHLGVSTSGIANAVARAEAT